MLCCVPRKKDQKQKICSETVYHNQHAIATGELSTDASIDKELAPIPTVVLTSYSDNETVQNEGDQFKVQDNEGHSSTSPMPVTLEVPTRKRIQRSPRITHQFEGTGADGDNATEKDGPLSHWSRASVSSLFSDSSTSSSYQTASSGPVTHDHSPTSAGGLPVKDPMTVIQSMKDELLQGMKEAFEEKMTEMEQKVENSQCRLEARVGDLERQLQEIHRENGTSSILTEGRKEVDEVPPVAGLHTVREVSCLLYFRGMFTTPKKNMCMCILYYVCIPCKFSVNTWEA